METNNLKSNNIEHIQTIKIENQINLKDNDDVFLNRPKRRLSLKILLVILILVCLFRIPYLGSYIDGCIDYVFNWTKYFVYLSLLFIVFSLMFKWKINYIFKTWKFVIFYFLFIFCLGCIISSFNCLVHIITDEQRFDQLIKQYHDTWIAYFKTTKYTNFFNLKYIGGGILPVIFTFIFNYACYIVLIVLNIILACCVIFVILNINFKNTKLGIRFRKWLITKLGGQLNCEYYDELKHNSTNVKIKKVSASEIKDIEPNNKTNLLCLLPQTAQDFNSINKSYILNIQDKLLTFFKQEKITCSCMGIKVYSTYSEVIFAYDNQKTLDLVLAKQTSIAELLDVKTYNFTLKKNQFTIQINNPKISKISLKSICDQIEHVNNFDCFFAIDKLNKPLIINLQKMNNIFIVGKKYSGSATLTILLILSLCFSTNPQYLEIIILSINVEPAYLNFKKIIHCQNNVFIDRNTIIKQLEELNSLITTRKNMCQMVQAKNIIEFNKNNQKDNSQIMKTKVIVIPAVDSLINNDLKINQLIQNILTNGRIYGIYCILQSTIVNNEIFAKEITDHIDGYFILQLNDQLESNKIFNDQRGIQLYGNGDCLFYKKNSNDTVRLQCGYISRDELDNDINLIQNFYKLQNNELENNNE